MPLASVLFLCGSLKVSPNEAFEIGIAQSLAVSLNHINESSKRSARLAIREADLQFFLVNTLSVNPAADISSPRRSTWKLQGGAPNQ